MYVINIEYDEYDNARQGMIQFAAKKMSQSENLNECKESLSKFNPGNFLKHVITITHRQLVDKSNQTKNGLLYMVSTLLRQEVEEAISEKKYSEQDVVIATAICNKISKLLKNSDDYKVSVMLTDLMMCIKDDDRLAKLVDVETEDPYI